MNRDRIRRERIFEIVDWPFKSRADRHYQIYPTGLGCQWQLDDSLKGQWTILKIHFTETYFSTVVKKDLAQGERLEQAQRLDFQSPISTQRINKDYCTVGNQRTIVKE